MDLFFRFGTSSYTRAFTERRILLSSTVWLFVTYTYLASEVFPDVDVAYHYVPLLLVSLHRVPACRLVGLDYLSLSELVLLACNRLYVWICMSRLTTMMYLLRSFHCECYLMNDSLSMKLLHAKISMLHSSRMVRPDGRDCGANNAPPPELWLE